jgi:hypothetical protein
MINKKEKLFLTFNQFREKKRHYIEQMIAGSIEIYIISQEHPPLKISLAELS